MREQWYVDLDREYVSERFAAARRRIDNLKLDWLDIEAMYTSSAAVFYTDEKLKELSGWSEEDIRILFADPTFPSADYGRRPLCKDKSSEEILSSAVCQRRLNFAQLRVNIKRFILNVGEHRCYQYQPEGGLAY